jgi:hypothetical protein
MNFLPSYRFRSGEMFSACVDGYLQTYKTDHNGAAASDCLLPPDGAYYTDRDGDYRDKLAFNPLQMEEQCPCTAPTTPSPPGPTTTTSTTPEPCCNKKSDDDKGKPSCSLCGFLGGASSTHWTYNVAYFEGECTINNDTLYRCLQDHTTIVDLPGQPWNPRVYPYTSWPVPLPTNATVGPPPNGYWEVCEEDYTGPSFNTESTREILTRIEIHTLLDPIFDAENIPRLFGFNKEDYIYGVTTTSSSPTSTTISPTSTTISPTSTTTIPTTTTSSFTISLDDLIVDLLGDTESVLAVAAEAKSALLDYILDYQTNDYYGISTQERLDWLRITSAYYNVLGRMYMESLKYADLNTTTPTPTTTSSPTTTTSAPTTTTSAP